MPKKGFGIYVMMLAYIVGPVGAKGCTVGTQRTFPVVPRHTLGCYFRLLVYLQCTLEPLYVLQKKLTSLTKSFFLLRHPVLKYV